MISTQIETQMNKMNVSIENAINGRHIQKYIYPEDISPLLTPTDSEMIVNTIAPGKPSEPIRDNLNVHI